MAAPIQEAPQANKKEREPAAAAAAAAAGGEALVAEIER